MDSIVTIDGIIRVENPPERLLSTVARTLKLPNQSYQQAIKRSPKARFFLSPDINYYEYDKQSHTLTLPRGVLHRVQNYFTRTGEPVTYRDLRSYCPVTFKSSIKLRPYQRGVLGHTDGRLYGTLRLDTGFGKSILALRLAELLQQRTLIVVPKLDLLTQFEYECNKYFDFTCGSIRGKRIDIQPITIATVQTLRKRIDDGLIPADAFGCTIYDECHLMVPSKSRAVVNYFRSAYRYGFTATLRRSDGQGGALNWIFGDKLVDKDVPRDVPDVEIVPHDTHIIMDEYYEIINDQVANSVRNDLICGVVKCKIQEGRKILILTKRVDHGEELHRRLASDRVFRINANDPIKKRKELLRKLKDEPECFDVVIGSTGIAAVGLDIPALDTLVIACDMKSDVLVHQAGGRILRLLDGKASALIVDIWDTKNPILKRQGKLRQNYYKDQGWEILQ